MLVPCKDIQQSGSRDANIDSAFFRKKYHENTRQYGISNTILAVYFL